MRGLKINKQVKRPDTPLAATPEPKPIKNNGGYATGVVISEKDIKAHPEDFKYLKK